MPEFPYSNHLQGGFSAYRDDSRSSTRDRAGVGGGSLPDSVVLGLTKLQRLEYAVARLATEHVLHDALRNEIEEVLRGEHDGDVLAWEESGRPGGES